jgi:hypothetical protein
MASPTGARKPLPAGLKFVKVLGADKDACRMFVLCDDPHGSGGQAVVAATKQPWTEEELRAIIEPDTSSLSCEHRNDKFSRHDGAVSNAVSLTLISPANEVDVGKYTSQRSFIVRETAALHEGVTRKFVDAIPPKQIAWVLAILDRKAEMERLLYEDDHCMLVRRRRAALRRSERSGPRAPDSRRARSQRLRRHARARLPPSAAAGHQVGRAGRQLALRARNRQGPHAALRARPARPARGAAARAQGRRARMPQGQVRR